LGTHDGSPSGIIKVGTRLVHAAGIPTYADWIFAIKPLDKSWLMRPLTRMELGRLSQREASWINLN